MKKTTLRVLALSTLLLLVSVAAYAQAQPHTIDKAHSQINFVAEARFISAHGNFGKWEAEVVLDPAKIEASSVKITIDAASINTQSDGRDNHLRNKDFFDVQQFPKITFVSKKIVKVDDRKFNVVGDMTIRNVTKEVTIPLTKILYEGGRGRFKGTFELNRTDFGMTYNSALNKIEDIVQVSVDMSVRAPSAGR